MKSFPSSKRLAKSKNGGRATGRGVVCARLFSEGNMVAGWGQHEAVERVLRGTGRAEVTAIRVRPRGSPGTHLRP